ncbi:hypothetical protein [Sciscionella sediminilitoris]|uniref:hypothetical protein n=1 Tax=Sciscionella sediminilitoris TaxID=1445613 RepID=UPI0004DED089|nr:hypothetical protein [Sciscionella sp. SE31]
MNPTGIWDLSISTPIGTLEPVLELREEQGTVVGTASGTGEEIPLRDLSVTQNRLTWHQSIRKPLRLNLFFDMTVDGDVMTGTSKAGRLPASTVTGRRRGA